MVRSARSASISLYSIPLSIIRVMLSMIVFKSMITCIMDHDMITERFSYMERRAAYNAYLHCMLVDVDRYEKHW